jgi:hypothetical protein
MSSDNNGGGLEDEAGSWTGSGNGNGRENASSPTMGKGNGSGGDSGKKNALSPRMGDSASCDSGFVNGLKTTSWAGDSGGRLNGF